MDIVARPLDELVPYAKNSRKHPQAQVDKLVRSLAEFGWTNPVLVDGARGIIAGHGRVLAARALANSGGAIPNWEDLATVPTIELGHLSEDQRRAYVIADNRLGLESGWDQSLLKAELSDLAGMDFDVSLSGFDDVQLSILLPTNLRSGNSDPDDVPGESERAVSSDGDVWVIGDHRIMCGSSIRPEQVSALLLDSKPHLMVTDPPYGVEYDANWRNDAMRADGTPIEGRAVGKVLNDGRADWAAAWQLFPGHVAYVWHAGVFAPTVAESLGASGFEIRSQLIWAKTRFAISRGHYHWQHEPCWYAVRKGGQGHWGGARDQATLWTISHNKSETGHSTQKPVECMRRPIENNSRKGDAVYEPFSGSGTTIIAAEQTGRRCYAMELHPQYVDVAVRRWQAFTGLRAQREVDGVSFNELEGNLEED